MKKSNPFQHLSATQRELIEEAYAAGKTPEIIGIQFGLDFDDVRYYLENFLTPARSHFERLQELVDDLESQCKKTKLAIDEGEDSAMMLQSYQKLMAEYRIALAELMSLQKPHEAIEEIIDKAFQPFVISLIRACTEEMHLLKKDLITLKIPVRDAQGISTDIFKRLGERINSLLPEARESLDSHFGVKSERAVAAKTKAVSKEKADLQ